jgi:hypothetical protein
LYLCYKVLYSNVFIIQFHRRDALQNTNNRLLKLLSDTVRNAAATEDTINRQLEDLIDETSQVESGFGADELSSATLYVSQFPPDSAVKRVRFLPPGTLTSTPAAGLAMPGPSGKSLA